ncbi:Rab-GTPase-TBC domain [Pseudocohnilembus persalinus]|uniref:Rab-GTPase-TBC domain n=1 Tax=Pseudocohnilembus persalinus TaxID=266149 RepID=A0A0V0R194_PSEPJ|nr:Rab-GTPase-TBC domain [Pseudocohnilembus persalinus]|eukprot:KRX08311.1 Rab-GTPase-TBC domain [Pseudocohnilembus persalinus]
MQQPPFYPPYQYQNKDQFRMQPPNLGQQMNYPYLNNIPYNPQVPMGQANQNMLNIPQDIKVTQKQQIQNQNQNQSQKYPPPPPMIKEGFQNNILPVLQQQLPQRNVPQQQQQVQVQQQLIRQDDFQYQQQVDLDQLRMNLEEEIKKLLFYLCDPMAQKPISTILRETCDKLKMKIEYVFKEDPANKNHHACETIIDQEHYGQGYGKSKKDARNDSARQASFKLLVNNTDALGQFKNQTQKEVEKRQASSEAFSQINPQLVTNPNNRNPYSTAQNVNQVTQEMGNKLAEQIPNNISQLRADNLDTYDAEKNYREIITQFSHKNLKQQVNFKVFQSQGEWVATCSTFDISESGSSQTQKEAKNIAAFKLFTRLVSLEKQDPEIFINQQKKSKNKRTAKQAGIDNTEYETEQIVQKQINTNQLDNTANHNNNQNQQKNQDQAQQQQEKDFSMLDNRFINFNNFENPYQDQEIELKALFKDMVKKMNTNNTTQNKNIENLVNEVMQLEENLKQIGIQSLLLAGSYSRGIMRSNYNTIDLVANYINNEFQKKQQQQQDQKVSQIEIVYQLLDQSLEKPFQNEQVVQQARNNQQDYYKTNQRVFLNKDDNSVKIHSLVDPKIVINLIFDDISVRNHQYCDTVHHEIWLNRFGKVEDYPNLKEVMQVIRQLRRQNSLEIVPVEIFDYVLFLVTKQFKYIQMKSIIEILENSPDQNSQKKILDYQQIENDIPRTHQYNNFANSNQGKLKILKVLKALLNSDKEQVYIQGIDSMCLTCLETFKYSEAESLAALSQICKKILKISDKNYESPELYIMNEKIPIFNLVLKLEDPELFTYLNDIGFMPEMYTISWFLTLFSMVFEVEIVQKIWDYILCNQDFTICFAVSLILELKDTILLQDQNDLMSFIKSFEGIIEFEQNALKVAQILIERGVRRFAIIKEGIEEIQEKYPDLIRKNHKATPLNYFKRKK